jgi:hypothetical protein
MYLLHVAKTVLHLSLLKLQEEMVKSTTTVEIFGCVCSKEEGCVGR